MCVCVCIYIDYYNINKFVCYWKEEGGANNWRTALPDAIGEEDDFFRVSLS